MEIAGAQDAAHRQIVAAERHRLFKSGIGIDDRFRPEPLNMAHGCGDPRIAGNRAVADNLDILSNECAGMFQAASRAVQDRPRARRGHVRRPG